ncbi:16S rRNA (guanine(527)-N(7))-methyltransferase RsmG [Neptunicella sp. SCSIO 80796]|uniref:16S rRNA (guanine(527)-N(7))-methyltransferase RsmG n=1 Tax=Neptunicella plasticusilytica TaxID=3117012 RepID=UPI003A4DC12F
MMQPDPVLVTHLQKWLESSTLTVNQQQLEQLVCFVQLMDKWNKAYNLTSVRDPIHMLSKHIIDSIVIAPELDKQSYIDVGTGPGLPGIPLAIMCPDKHFVLLDSLGKRVRFMKQAGYELGLKNIQPVQSRVEQYQSDIEFDGVISRAFASLKDMLHWCQHLVDSQGKFLALKGLYPELELNELPPGFSLVQAIKLDIPGLDADRHLIKISKNKN